jgi:hypothetical protein
MHRKRKEWALGLQESRSLTMKEYPEIMQKSKVS